MKHFFIIFLKLLFTVVILCILPLIYNFLFLDQRDFGLESNYSYCENGIYKTYPRGITDGSDTYFDKNNIKIGECHSWVPGDTCESAQNLAGMCKVKGFTPIFYYFF